MRLELQLRVVQLVLVPASGTGSIQWCVNELILPHQDLALVSPRTVFGGVISNYTTAEPAENCRVLMRLLV